LAPTQVLALVLKAEGCAPKKSTTEWLGGRKPQGRHPDVTDFLFAETQKIEEK